MSHTISTVDQQRCDLLKKKICHLGNDPNQIHYDGGTGKLTYGNGFSVSKNELHFLKVMVFVDMVVDKGKCEGTKLH